MKALILVGGKGTRLRPLTYSKPKPLVEFCNQPMMMHQITSLVNIGVNHVILAVNYKPEMMAQVVESSFQKARDLGIKITVSQEKEPLGTAGAIALARDQLLDDGNQNEPFFVLNSDIICDYPFQEMVDFHNSHDGEGTIVVTRVEEPSKYGVVVYNEKTGKVDRFVEKPIEFVSNKINAGLYLFNKSILNRIPLQVTSIEKQTFPEMANDKQLYALELSSYWMDVGQPGDFLRGMQLYLNWTRKTNPSILSSSEGIVGDVLIDKSAKIGKGCQIGPDVCIGPNVVVEDGLLIKKSTILAGSKLCSYTRLDGCIIGWKCVIGKWVQMENTCVLGESVVVEDEIHLNGARILHDTTVSASVHEPNVIM